MITPIIFRSIIKHFDEIDRIVSDKTVRKRPWLEVALTSLLCDVLDEETQDDQKLNYTFKQLQDDLEKEDSLFGINLTLETIEFNSTYERYISQSDIGLNLIFDNKLEPYKSWSRPYLLQAKRLSPKKINPLSYTEASLFASLDKDQQKRIDLLNKILGASYLKYLLFCPRPENIDDETKTKLAYLRYAKLSNGIFDYTFGLEIHNELSNSSDTLKAGIFITDVENSNLNFGQVHSQVLQETFPFSWFIAMNFLNQHDFLDISRINIGMKKQESSKNKEMVEGILSGDSKKIDELIKRIGEAETNTIPENIQILPKHKITLRVSVGEKINPDSRIIQNQ